MIHRVDRQLNEKVIGCFLEFGSPSWVSTIANYAQSNQLTIMPLFFLRGKHYEKDIRNEVEKIQSPVNLLSPLVEDVHFIDCLQSTYQVNTPLVLATHGSDHQNAYIAMCYMAKELSEKNDVPTELVMLAQREPTKSLSNFYQKFGKFTILPLTFGKGKVFQEIEQLPEANLEYQILEPLSFDRNMEEYIMKKITLKEGR